MNMNMFGSHRNINSASPCAISDLQRDQDDAFLEDDTHNISANHMRNSSPSSFSRQSSFDWPHLSAVKSALSTFNVTALENMVKKGMWTSDTIIDSRKFRNPLHHLILCYINKSESGTVSGLQQRFAECLSVLTENGLDINESDITRNTPLHLICNQCGMDGIIKTLLVSGSKVNAENANQQTALHLAAENGGAKDVEALLEAGADPNKLDCVGISPLHNAVKLRRNQEMIKCLVNHGAMIDLQSRDGHPGAESTPLHIAVKRGREENVNLLLKLGAMTEVVDSSRQTPLHLAAKYDITGNIVKCLLDGGANINCTDAIWKETPCHKAIKHTMVENIEVLVRRGASLSQLDAYGDSPLHIAALCCQSSGIWLVLLKARQVDTQVRNAKGETVHDIAQKTENGVCLFTLPLQ